MEKKLFQKEREEYATKGFIEDQNFVTKDYLDMRFEKAQKESFAHFEAIMEGYNDKIYTLIELFQGRFERIEHRLNVLEA